MTIRNPILRGFNPDPSIVRVGDDYFVATSTFEWFPGVQIHHSRDLANWRLAARPLNRPAPEPQSTADETRQRRIGDREDEGERAEKPGRCRLDLQKVSGIHGIDDHCKAAQRYQSDPHRDAAKENDLCDIAAAGAQGALAVPGFAGGPVTGSAAAVGASRRTAPAIIVVAVGHESLIAEEW